MPFSLQLRSAAATDAHALAALAIQVWLDTYATDGVNELLGRHVLDAFTPSGFAALAQDAAGRTARSAGRFYEKPGFSLKGRTWFALGEDRHENHVFAVP